MSQLDIVILVILVLSFIIGYIKGFVHQAIHLVINALILFVSYILGNSIGQVVALFLFHSYFKDLQLLFPASAKIAGFFLVFIVLMIVKGILLYFIEPIIEKLLHSLTITSFADRMFGALLSALEGVCLSTAIIIVLCLPMVSNGYIYVEDSFIAQNILMHIPNVEETVESMQLIRLSNKRDYNKESILLMVDLLEQASKSSYYDADTVKSITDEYDEALRESNQSYTVSQSEYDHIVKVLNDAKIDEQFKQDLLDKVSVA